MSQEVLEGGVSSVKERSAPMIALQRSDSCFSRRQKVVVLVNRSEPFVNAQRPQPLRPGRADAFRTQNTTKQRGESPFKPLSISPSIVQNDEDLDASLHRVDDTSPSYHLETVHPPLLEPSDGIATVFPLPDKLRNQPNPSKAPSEERKSTDEDNHDTQVRDEIISPRDEVMSPDSRRSSTDGSIMLEEQLVKQIRKDLNLLGPTGRVAPTPEHPRNIYPVRDCYYFTPIEDHLQQQQSAGSTPVTTATPVQEIPQEPLVQETPIQDSDANAGWQMEISPSEATIQSINSIDPYLQRKN